MRSVRLRSLGGLIPVIGGLVIVFVVTLAIPQAVRYFGKASGNLANITVNYEGVLGQMPQLWKNLAQGGEEAKDMLSVAVGDIKALKPEYIRLDHIYDAFNVVSGEGDTMQFNWNGLDGAVDTILATGAKPMLSLSYMPLSISSGDIISLPKKWSDWGRVVQATIEHYSGKQEKNIDKMIYEVWNEPDLFGDYKTYGDKNYLDMYEASARAADNAKNVNDFEIGGPATTALYQNWEERLIKFVAEKNLRLDFISWHKYTLDLEEYEKDVKQVRAWAENIPALVNLKYYVTEWGHNSEVDEGYDNNFGAIHTMAGVRAMMGVVQRAFLFEIKDGIGGNKYWGRWGILTHEKWGAPEKKPRYQAIEFLNELGPFRISVKGEGSWVKSIASTNEKGDLKLLLVNYDSNKAHSEAVPVTFENLPSGSFSYTKKVFMGESKNLRVATSSASWQTIEYMEPNSATLLTLEF